MKRVVVGCLLLLLCITWVQAEPVQVDWTEPTASGTLAHTTVYWCLGTGCTNWTSGLEFRKGSDNGNGGDAKTLTFVVPLAEGTLPIVLRVKVTATSTSNNENTGTIVEHTFSN
jgi:hypothetical protein